MRNLNNTTNKTGMHKDRVLMKKIFVKVKQLDQKIKNLLNQ